MLINVLLELIEIKLVSILILAITFAILLDCIIGEMDHVVLAVIKYVFKSRRPQVAFSAEKDFHVLVYKYPNSNVKLSIVY